MARLLIATRDNSSLFLRHFSFIMGLAAPPAPPGCWPGCDRISPPPPAGEPTSSESTPAFDQWGDDVEE